ncbi:site-specific integrase [Lysobacter enzymogenes]|uniref:site-specific integrase n=1 Tax=Lysobacter enzymogenes TaxID=69 RepID=UPI001AF8E355|nr:site-specific integrase [Lysobacter enzymogenes]QQP99562.1 site-specific integrase [Lysobacter enzymogenes]
MPQIRRQTLTKIMVEGVKPKASPYRLWDAKVPGLALRVLPSGRSTYEVHWGRNKSLALGTNGVMTLEGARTAARRILGEVAEHGAPLDAANSELGKNLTFGDFISERYGPYILATRKAGGDTLAAITAQFGELFRKPLASISKADWDEIKTRRISAGIHPSTVNRDLDRLKAALFQAVEWKLLPDNPLRGVKRIKRGIENRVRFLSKKEEKGLRAALDARERTAKQRRDSGNKWREARGKELLPAVAGYSDNLMPIVLLALNTGMRRGELKALTWDDIDMPNKVLTVRAGYAKSGETRHIPLNSEAMAVLRNLKKHNGDRGKLFDVGSFSKAWSGVLDTAKIADFRFHDLRHTFASNLVMAGVALNTVRELLGHSEIEMTLRYAHLAPSHKAEAVAALVKRRALRRKSIIK